MNVRQIPPSPPFSKGGTDGRRWFRDIALNEANPEPAPPLTARRIPPFEKGGLGGISRLLLASCLLLAAGLAHAAPPTEVHASYRLLRNGQQMGVVNETYKQEGNRYTLQSETSAVGIFALFAKGKIRLESSGEVTADGLRPIHFEHHRGADPAKTITADFDWDKQTVTHKFDGNTETAELKPGTQDRISMQYQFMFKPPQKGEILLPTTTGKKLNVYRYQVAGEEKVTVPAGAFRATHLTKQHAADEDGTEIWLAKSRRYFPVRIVFEEKDGTRLEQQLISVEFGGKKAR